MSLLQSVHANMNAPGSLLPDRPEKIMSSAQVQVSPLVEVANVLGPQRSCARSSDAPCRRKFPVRIALQGSRHGSKGGPLRLEAVEEALEAPGWELTGKIPGTSTHVGAKDCCYLVWYSII